MAKTDYKTVNEYHEAFPEDVQQRMQTVRALIHKIAPEAEEVISYQIPAFKIGKKFLIYYGAFDKHLTISHPWSKELLSEFEPELKTMKVSKSAIQLPYNKELPINFIERLLKFRKKEMESIKSLMVFIFITLFTNLFGQTPLENSYRRQVECINEKTIHSLDSMKTKEVKVRQIWLDEKLIVSLHNYSSDTLELKNDCYLHEFIVEIKVGDGSYTHKDYCDHLQFRKFYLLPLKAIQSAFPISSEWVGKEIRTGIEVNGNMMYSEWLTITN